MGQKVHPIGFRLGVPDLGWGWKSRWFAPDGEYAKFLLEDLKLRAELTERLKLAGVHDIEIERLPKAITVRLVVSRPGVVIGRGGTGIEDIKNFVLQKMGYKPGDAKAPKVDIPVEEIKNPELSARLVAGRITGELERRLPHRRVVTRAMERVMAAGAAGVKVVLSGRIEGAEISRREKKHQGSIPAHTLRANIDYAEGRALLKRGYVGVKVWVNRKIAEHAT